MEWTPILAMSLTHFTASDWPQCKCHGLPSKSSATMIASRVGVTDIHTPSVCTQNFVSNILCRLLKTLYRAHSRSSEGGINEMVQGIAFPDRLLPWKVNEEMHLIEETSLLTHRAHDTHGLKKIRFRTIRFLEPQEIPYLRSHVGLE